MADSEDIVNAAGLGSDCSDAAGDDAGEAMRAAGLDTSDDDGQGSPAPTDEDPQRKAEFPNTDDGGPSTSRPQSQRSDALKAAGLEDSDIDKERAWTPDEAGPSGAPPADPFDDDFAAVEALPKPGMVQRLTGPEEAWQLPLVPRPEEALHVAHFKSLLDIEPEEYNPAKFTIDDEVTIDENGRRVKRAPVLNRLRWRFTDEIDVATGANKRESNARFVRWDDGSLSLFIGKECVDVVETAMSGRQMLLGVYHEGNAAIQGQCLIHSRLAFRPPDVHSALHRNVARMPTASNTLTETIKASHVLGDFHRDHLEAVDREQEQLKLKEKQEKSGRRRHGTSAVRRPPQHRVNAAYLEADDDEDGYQGLMYDVDAEEEREQRLEQAKRTSLLSKRPLEEGRAEYGVVKAVGGGASKRQLTLDDSDDDF